MTKIEELRKEYLDVNARSREIDESMKKTFGGLVVNLSCNKLTVSGDKQIDYKDAVAMSEWVLDMLNQRKQVGVKGVQVRILSDLPKKK